MSTNRKNWFERTFGKDKAQRVREDLSKAAADLDAAGMERKEVTEEIPSESPAEVPADPAPENGDMVGRVAAKLAADVTAAVSGDYSQLTEDKLRALLADAMQPEADEAPPAEAENAETQMAEDKSKPERVAVPEWDGERFKSLLDTLTQQTVDHGEMAKSITDLADQVEAIKALGPKIAELVEWKTRIEQQLAMRPRASADEATIISNTGDLAAVADAINKGLQGPETLFLGHIPVKNNPT